MSKLLKVFMTSGDSCGCGYYRTRLPAEHLGADWYYGFPPKDPRVNTSDVIFLQRAVHEYFLEWIPMAKNRGQKIIFDIDDNLWEIPATNLAHNAYNKKTLKLVARIMGLCSAITVSTIPLKEYLLKKGIHDNIHVIPNMIEQVMPLPEDDGELRIGWAGTHTHAGDFSFELIKALRYVKEKYNAKLYFLGYTPLCGAEDRFINWVLPEDYINTLYDLKLDIAIAPIEDNHFNRCKSNIKFLEYSACGIPTIASNVFPYAQSITDGENGILIKKEKEWKGALETLIEMEYTRKQMARTARELVSSHMTYENNGSYISSCYKELFDNV